MLTTNEVTEFFYKSNYFSKEFEASFKKYALEESKARKKRNKPNRLFDSEVMTILVAFLLSGMRNLKHFYVFYVKVYFKEEFQSLGSCNRFVKL